MERRIKALYIITIIAILAFLWMQGYWLYVRYGFTLKEYESNLADRVTQCVDRYNNIRGISVDTINRRDTVGENGIDTFTIPTFSLSQQYSDTVKTTRTAKVLTYLYSAHELLGLEPGTPLSDEQKQKAMDLARTQMLEPADSVVFDASGAKDETEAWTATRNVQTERRCPFMPEGLDSIMAKERIKAEINLIQADSMVWETKVNYHISALRPEVSLTIPYSQLEGKVVNIVCKMNPFDVFPEMKQTLLISILISTLLIVCLVAQISTVLKLSRLDKMRNSFITTMIHELKRPISTLKMCVSGLENDKMMSEHQTRSELLAESRTALDNLSAYFSKLRDITFNNVEQIPLNIQTISLHDLFDNVAAATMITSGKTVVFNNNINRDLVVSADKSHLYNILNNLVENAVKYSGSSVEIKATATKCPESVTISISDNGNGISSGDLRHIFNRFYRGDASGGEMPGMGLGLTYVKLLVEAHGGEITVQSAFGRGACFTIKLPQ